MGAVPPARETWMGVPDDLPRRAGPGTRLADGPAGRSPWRRSGAGPRGLPGPASVRGGHGRPGILKEMRRMAISSRAGLAVGLLGLVGLVNTAAGQTGDSAVRKTAGTGNGAAPAASAS